MKRRRIGITAGMALLGAVVLITIGGCAATPPSKSDIVGTWATSPKPSREEISTLTFRADGKFTWSDVPCVALEMEEIGNGKFGGAGHDVSGTWSLGDDQGNLTEDDGTPVVRIVLSKPECGGSFDELLAVHGAAAQIAIYTPLAEGFSTKDYILSKQ